LNRSRDHHFHRRSHATLTGRTVDDGYVCCACDRVESPNVPRAWIGGRQLRVLVDEQYLRVHVHPPTCAAWKRGCEHRLR
jgi:hypothetical protein